MRSREERTEDAPTRRGRRGRPCRACAGWTAARKSARRREQLADLNGAKEVRALAAACPPRAFGPSASARTRRGRRRLSHGWVGGQRHALAAVKVRRNMHGARPCRVERGRLARWRGGTVSAVTREGCLYGFSLLLLFFARRPAAPPSSGKSPTSWLLDHRRRSLRRGDRALVSRVIGSHRLRWPKWPSRVAVATRHLRLVTLAWPG